MAIEAADGAVEDVLAQLVEGALGAVLGVSWNTWYCIGVVAPPSRWDFFSAEGERFEQKVKTPALDNEDGYRDCATDAIKLIVRQQVPQRCYGVWFGYSRSCCR